MSKCKIALVLLLLTAVCTSTFAASVSVQIREGVYKEEIEGDLDGAMKIYEEIARMHSDNTRYAAQAMYRLGLCYIKKGQQNSAIAQFQQITTKYPTERSTVRKAKLQLKKLKPTASNTNAQNGLVSQNAIVVNTTPVIYTGDVSPDLKEIKVTFDREMRDGGWSWTGGGETFPETTGKIHYDSQRKTCILPVKLKAGQYYWIGINSPSHKNFKSTDMVPAKRYVIIFATKGTDGKPTIIPADRLNMAKQINNAKPVLTQQNLNMSAQETTNPKVIQSFPATYSNDISVDTDKLTVTFDQPMIKGNFSWVKWNYTFPETTGKPFYDSNGTTCTLPVKLAPGTAYLVRINAKPYDSFMNLEGIKAQPFVLVFTTKDINGKPTPIPQEMLTFAKSINGTISTSNKVSIANPSPTGQSDSSNILQNLIDNAKARSIVTVPAGVYTSPITINKPITLVGSSRDKCILEITADAPAIMIDTKGSKQPVTVKDMTIKWQLATSSKTTENPYALGVKDGTADIINCVFRPLGNAQRSPVAIRTSGFTKMDLSDCDFEGFEYTVCYGDGTTGTVQDCYIAGSGHQGVICYTGAKINVKNNIITGSKFHAVRNTGGSLNLTSNLIINNANRGVYLGNGTGRGDIRNNVISGNGTGIGGFASARYTIQNNVIMSNTYSGISMEKSCNFKIHSNIFMSNERGWVMFDRGEGNGNSCQQNVFWKNKVDAENFMKTGNSITEKPQFADIRNGDFTLTGGAAKQAKQGLLDAETISDLWKKWKKRQKGLPQMAQNGLTVIDSFEEGNSTAPLNWQQGAAVDGVKYIWDKKTGHESQSSLCLKKVANKYFPIAQWTRKLEHTSSSSEVEVSAMVKAQKTSKATIDALFLDADDKWIKHEWISYIGAKDTNDKPANHNWKQYKGTVAIPENTKTIVIGLQIYGPGTVWFDDLSVTQMQ